MIVGEGPIPPREGGLTLRCRDTEERRGSSSVTSDRRRGASQLGTRNSELIFSLDGYEPRIDETVFVAPNAAIVGNVSIGAESSVWFSATLRADNGENAITIGQRTSIQDGAVIHVSTHRGTAVGNDVTVGHCAVLEGCTIRDRAVVGMNAVVLEDAEICEGAMVAAGCVVSAGMKVPPRMLVAGVPAVIKKEISGASAGWIEHSAAHYVELARRYREPTLIHPSQLSPKRTLK